jgi:hypothetical protein
MLPPALGSNFLLYGVILSATNFLAFEAMLVSSPLFWVLRCVILVSAGTIFLIAGIITIPILVAAVRAWGISGHSTAV